MVDVECGIVLERMNGYSVSIESAAFGVSKLNFQRELVISSWDILREKE